MSGAIWGASLTAYKIGETAGTVGAFDLCDLRNWSTDNMDDSYISYDPAHRRNVLRHVMAVAPDKMYYKIQVDPYTEYTFQAYIDANFSERNFAVTNKQWHTAMAVTSERVSTVMNKITGDQLDIVLGYTFILSGVPAIYRVSFNTGSLSEVYLYFDFDAVTDNSNPTFIISGISCLSPIGEPISYAQKPFNLNILDGDVWNFIAVEPGAWFYTVFDDHKTHHMFLLNGNEFKLLEFQDADGNGVIPHKEYHSSPIVIKGKQYHSLYLSRTVDSVCPFPTEYHKRSEMPSDEYFYEKLSEYVCNHMPFERGDALGLLALRNLLSANSGDVNVDIDDLKAMLKGYMVEERQNPYLDDPNLDDAGHPTTSFHD